MANAPVDQSAWLEFAIDAAPEMQDALGAFFLTWAARAWFQKISAVTRSRPIRLLMKILKFFTIVFPGT